MLAVTLVFALLWEVQTKKNVCLINTRIQKTKEFIFMFLTFMPMYLVNSCMEYVGTDYEEYFKYFERLGPTSGWHMDWAFEQICKLIKAWGMPFQTVYFVVCLIGYAFLILCIRKYTKSYVESYLLYFAYGFFYMLGLTLLRQFVAMMLVWYAYSYIKEQRFIKYVLFVLVASLFHFSALIMLPMYFVLNRKLKLSFFAVLAICTLPFNLNYSEIMYWLFKTFKPSYLNSNFLTKEFEIDVPYLICFLVTVGVVILYGMKYRENSNELERERIALNSVYIGLFISLFCVWLPIYKRFAMYFLLPAITLVPNLLRDVGKKQKIIFYVIQLAACIFYNSRYIVWWEVLPYKSIF